MEWAVQVSGDYRTLLDAARFAEDRGLAALAVIDHYLMSEDEARAQVTPALDAFVALGGLARDTERIELSVLVSPITFRHPAVIAKSAVTLQELSGGRFKLGIGSGWFDREHEIFGIPYPETAERFEMLEEALQYLQAAFDPENPGFEGEHFRLEPFPMTPVPEGGVPILIGGSGKVKTPRLAGTYADEFNPIELRLHDVPERVERSRGAASEAGRDPAEMLVSYNSPVAGFDDETQLEVWIAGLAAETGRSGEDLAAAIQQSASLLGTWEQIEAKIADLEAAGISRYYLGFWDEQWDRAKAAHFLDRVGSS